MASQRSSTRIGPARTTRLSAALLIFLIVGSARAYEVVLSPQGEYMDGYLVNGKAFPPRVIVDDPDPHPPDALVQPPYIGGRHLNGKVCFFPRRVPHHHGHYLVADDEYREACLDPHPPQARCSVTDPKSPFYVGVSLDGWAVFSPKGKWTRQHIQVQGQPNIDQNKDPQGAKDPQGCAFLPDGRLIATDVGSEEVGVNDGALMVFFPGPRGDYSTYCFLDEALSDPGMPVLDDADNIYVPEPQGRRVTKFSPPYPSSAAGCAGPGQLVTTLPQKSTWLKGGANELNFPVSITRLRRSDHFYVAGAIFPPIINEYDANGAFVRNIVPANVPKNPLGMDVGRDGTLYYAELNLDPTTFNPRCGSVSMVQFDKAGNPQPPVTLGMNLNFPDGITVVDSSKLRIRFRKLRPSPDVPASECGGE
jgi:hypothetical protein